MPEPSLHVVCNHCGREVSPYVTECPYCGNRLRKRAPDLKKMRQAEQKQQRRAARRRARSAGPGAVVVPTEGRTPTTFALLGLAVAVSLVAASGLPTVSAWIDSNLMLTREFSAVPWALVSAPLVQAWFGYGFVCLGIFALFSIGLERRFGPFAVLVVWLLCGALGVLAEALIAPVPLSYGAYAVATGAFLAWTVVVVRGEDLRDHDALGLAAIAFVLCALPLATSAASVWMLLGGIIGGLICGGLLSHMPRH